MSQFGIVLTTAGAALQELIHTGGGTLVFKRMAVGDGALPEGGTLIGRTALVSQKQTVNIANCRLLASGHAAVRADISNHGLVTGYDMREVGLFAEDPVNTGQEILYAYGNAGATPDYMPADSGGDVVLIIQEIVVGIGDVAVTATVDEQAVYITQAQWNGHVGVGGTAQHPAATEALAGFMSAADKTALDRMKASYRRMYNGDESKTTPSGVTTNGKRFGIASTDAGEILSPQGRDVGFAMMYSINVNVAASGNISIPVFNAADGVRLYVDGTLIGQPSGGVITWAAIAGSRLVQFIFTSGSDRIGVGMVGEWIDGSNIVFASTPA
jgi:hypothetical protein